MEVLYILISLLPLPVLLNRWRGTGAIVTIGKFRLIGNIIYALYIAGIVGCAVALTNIMLPFTSIVLNGSDNIYVFNNSQILSSIVYGLLGGILYIAGESFAWGKWVGHITDYEKLHAPDYDNDDGRSFPYIHYIAQSIVKQEVNYTRYCEIALAIRGLFWWLPIFTLLYLIGLVQLYVIVVSLVVLSVGFPLAAHLGNYVIVEYRSKYLNMSRGWENQELVYGLFHWIAINLVLVFSII